MDKPTAKIIGFCPFPRKISNALEYLFLDMAVHEPKNSLLILVSHALRRTRLS